MKKIKLYQAFNMQGGGVLSPLVANLDDLRNKVMSFSKGVRIRFAIYEYTIVSTDNKFKKFDVKAKRVGEDVYFDEKLEKEYQLKDLYADKINIETYIQTQKVALNRSKKELKEKIKDIRFLEKEIKKIRGKK